ncbi:MAG: hypothetical protein EA391_11175 [Balneolaceae bacterium]|nr:MAG: hypothetical protein EA391_11175 [Balneolaceae bacterium]
MRTITILSVLLLALLSCRPEYESNDYLNPDTLPFVVPAKLMEVDRAGDFYFDHLNYSSVVLNNGNVIISDRSRAFIVELSPEGDLVRKIAGKGRGPGEVQDIDDLSLDLDHNLYTFDQINQKILIYPSDMSNPIELQPFQPDEYRVRSVHALQNKDKLLVRMWLPSAIMNESENYGNRMMIYDRKEDIILSDRKYPDRDIARQAVGGMIVGATRIPYSSNFLFSIPAGKQSVLVSWTETNEIAEIDLNFDTLRTIQVNIKQELLTRIEIDSLEQTYSDRNPNPWPAIYEKLPEYKVSFDDMITDHLDQIWLKLTRKSEWQEWLILSTDGEPQKIIRLPKEGMLTHVSEHHIGFREDDHIFALYEPVN